MMPRDRLNHCLKFVSNPGNRLKEIKHGELQVDGTIKLVVDRIEDTDEVIQSYAQSTMIDNIIARIQAGQVDLLHQREGFFMDTVGLPATYADVLNLVIQGQQVFEKLPVDVKQRFDNDFNKWFVAMDKADWFEKSGFVSPVGETAANNDAVEGETKE